MTTTEKATDLAHANAEAYRQHLTHKRACQQCWNGEHFCSEGRRLINRLLETRLALGYADVRRDHAS